jgi:hypothetical protein
MNTRSQVQQNHDNSIINEFISWHYSLTGELFDVISRPDPPDAIVRSERRTTWIEVTDAFFSKEWAKDIFSYATPGEPHREMAQGSYMGMDDQIVDHFLKVLEQKFSKDSYFEVFSKYGSGILIAGLQSPWADDRTCELAVEAYRAYKKDRPAKDKGYFSNVFVTYRLLDRQVFAECT